MNDKMQEILQTAIGEKVWVTAHRGCFGGGIVENTIAAYQNALRAGADIVETDVTKLMDGELVLFHDEDVDRLTSAHGFCTGFTANEFRKLKLLNAIGADSGMRPNTLDEFLQFMKGKAVVNLDKCRTYMDEVYQKVLHYEMEDQIMLKSDVSYKKDVQWLRETGYRPLYVPVVTKDADIPLLYQIMDEIEVKIVEIFFYTINDSTISREFISDLHSRGIKIFANALTLSGHRDYCAGRGDNLSLLEGADKGWGFLVDRGIDIIQTDWTRECCEYLKAIGKR